MQTTVEKLFLTLTYGLIFFADIIYSTIIDDKTESPHLIIAAQKLIVTKLKNASELHLLN